MYLRGSPCPRGQLGGCGTGGWHPAMCGWLLSWSLPVRPPAREVRSQCSLPRVPRSDFFLGLLELPPPWMAGSMMLWVDPFPQEAAGQEGHTQSLTWAQGQLLGVQLPFPVPHLQRPSDSGSHSRDSTPREQFSEGPISQPCACSPLLPSLSLVPGVQ